MSDTQFGKSCADTISQFCSGCGSVLRERPIVSLNREDGQYRFDTFTCYERFVDGIAQKESA